MRDHKPTATLSSMGEWKKSTFSNPSGNCVEVRKLSSGGFMMRNSRFPDAEFLLFTTEEFEGFLRGVKSGEFDTDAL